MRRRSPRLVIARAAAAAGRADGGRGLSLRKPISPQRPTINYVNKISVFSCTLSSDPPPVILVLTQLISAIISFWAKHSSRTLFMDGPLIMKGAAMAVGAAEERGREGNLPPARASVSRNKWAQ